MAIPTKSFLEPPPRSHKMNFSTCARAAIVATINHLTSHSSWLAVPSAAVNSGIIFVHKRASSLFGNGIKTVDLFTPVGEPSRLAVEIHRIAENHGLIAATAEITACPIIIQAAEESMFYAAEQQCRRGERGYDESALACSRAIARNPAETSGDSATRVQKPLARSRSLLGGAAEPTAS